MKRRISLLIMLLMVVSLVLPISTVSNAKQIENDVVEPILLSDITYEIEAAKIVEQTPTPEPTPDPHEIAMENMQSEMKEIESIENKKEWFLAYKDIVFKYVEWIDQPETVFDEFSADEVRLICQVVETECYGKTFESKCNVASVVFNRLEDGRFGETITKIVTQKEPKQFAYGRTKLTEDSILAVQYAYEIGDTTQGALYFHSNKKTDTFNKRKWIFTDNAGHHFY